MPRDERTYITVHDGMPDHPKIEGLSDAAFRLLVSTWCWCSRNRTDGHVPANSWRKRGREKTRRELVDAGLAHPTGDGGVSMHDYLQHQRSATEIDELSRKRSEAGKKGGKAKAIATANAKALAKQNSGKVVADTDTELARDTSSKTHARRAQIPDDWKPAPADVDWQRAEGIADAIARRELPRFVDHWRGKGEVRADWSATWRNWLRRAGEYGPRTVNATTRTAPEW